MTSDTPGISPTGQRAGFESIGPRGRVLLISYHFGLSGATGGFRWAGMVPELSASGWEFRIVTASPVEGDSKNVIIVDEVKWPNAVKRLVRSVVGWLRSTLKGRSDSRLTSAAIDAPLERENSDRLGRIPLHEIERATFWRPAQARTIREQLTRAYDAVLALAATLHWSLRAVRAAGQLHRQHAFDVVIVSSPPHSSQFAGILFSRLHSIAYVADLRDPWIAGIAVEERERAPVAQLIEAALERSALRRAAAIVYNNRVALARAASAPIVGSQVRTSIPNGYDDRPVAVEPDRDCFRIVFAGWLYDFMDPRPLFRGIQQLRTEFQIPTEKIRLEFLGTGPTLGGFALRDVVDAYGLTEITTYVARLPRPAALEAQSRAAVLVAYDCPYPSAVPMKFYDYLLARGDLLLFSQTGSALEEAARVVNASIVTGANPVEVNAALRQSFTRWQTGSYPTSIDCDGRFARTHRTREFHEILNSICVKRSLEG